MNNPKRFNAWTEKMIFAIRDELAAAAGDDEARVVVLTGSDPYYCAGVDLSAVIKPMHPKALHELIRAKNQDLFDMFLDFPKPIIAAINGPAIGASVTSATLCDAIIMAEEGATLPTPFARLGVPPEGCSSLLFERRMGATAAERMLGPEGWAPTAVEAAAAGIHPDLRVVPRAQLLEAAQALAEEMIADGRARAGEPRELHARDGGAALAELKRTNAEESLALASAFLSKKFLQNQADFLASRGKTGPAALFRLLVVAQPLLERMAGATPRG